MRRDDDRDPPADDRDLYPEDDPTDPSHPDFDLSEAAPYSPYEGAPRPWFTRRWFLMIVALLVVVGLFLPYLRTIL
jgi:hypothetical protein